MLQELYLDTDMYSDLLLMVAKHVKIFSNSRKVLYNKNDHLELPLYTTSLKPFWPDLSVILAKSNCHFINMVNTHSEFITLYQFTYIYQ
jgi:hypothetical protein